MTAQSLQQTYSKEIEVLDTVTIHAKGALNLSWEMHGEVHSKGTERGFEMISGSSNSPITIKINNYRIKTWGKNIIKQEVKMSITPDKSYPKDAQELLNHLSINLNQQKNDDVSIDDNMNIKKLKFVNGWFKTDKNTVILDDGTAYNFGTLEISPTLYIPKNSHLELISDQLRVVLDDLEGSLVLHANIGWIKGGNVGHLKAVLQYAVVDFKSIKLAEINAKASTISAKNIDQLVIGSLLLAKDPRFDLSSSLFMSGNSDSHSALNKYYLGQVRQLQIAETANDEFTIEAVNQLTSLQSTFSNYNINELNGSLEMSARSGDLNIQQISNGFEKIDIYNHISTLSLGLKNTPNFTLNTYKNPYTNYTVADYFKNIALQNDKKTSLTIGDAEKAGQIDIRCESCKVILK